MTVIDKAKKAESSTVRNLKQGDTFIYNGSVCMKVFAPDNDYRFVRLSDGETWFWGSTGAGLDKPVKKVDYVALPQSELLE